jgi:hypothetical protein
VPLPPLCEVGIITSVSVVSRNDGKSSMMLIK